MSNGFASIPEPTPTVEGLLETVQALKTTVEVLAGLRAGQPAAYVFLQSSIPSQPKVGDLWINSGNGVMTYWNGTTWLLVA